MHNTGEIHEMLAAFEVGALSYKESQIEDDEIEHGITWSVIWGFIFAEIWQMQIAIMK